MNKEINNIINETCGIGASLETIDGQMTFFSHLIEDCKQYPDGMSALLKIGEVQKQPEAIYMLFHYELKRINKYNEGISKLANEVENNDE